MDGNQTHFARKYRIYPTIEQKKILSQDFGNARFTYNFILKLSQQLRKEKKTRWSSFDFSKYLPSMKKDTDTSFLSLTYSQVLQSAVVRLDSSFKNFFAGLAKFPHLKKRKGRSSIIYPDYVIPEPHAGLTSFPGKLGNVRTIFHRQIPDLSIHTRKSTTVSKDPSGRYWVSILFKKNSNNDTIEGSTDGSNEPQSKKVGPKGAKPVLIRKKGAKKDEIKRTLSNLGALFTSRINSKGRDLIYEFNGRINNKTITENQINNSLLNTNTKPRKQSTGITQKDIDAFVSSLISDESIVAVLKQVSVGIDMGVKTLIVGSDGTEIANPKFLKKKQDKLKRAQKKLSRSVTASRNKDGKKGTAIIKGEKIQTTNRRKKQVLKVAKLHAKVSDARIDYAYQSAHLLCKSWSFAGIKAVFTEDLNVKGMVKNHKLAKSISDAAFGQYLTILKYVASKYGISLFSIGRFDPSSKKCSDCGYIYANLTLKERYWVCPCCGINHDRDKNAAVNINIYGIEKILNGIFSEMLPVKAKPEIIAKEALINNQSGNEKIPQELRNSSI